MSLSQDQLASVAQWFAAGASLDEIQKRIASEFGIHMTYLDLRILVADLPQPEEKEEVPAELPPEANDGAGEAAVPEAPPPSPVEDENAQQPAGDVSVSIDPITPPGVMAGGSVTFSDGTSGKWYLDQMGRLGLGNFPQGYRPSPEDATLFQTRLMEALRAKGLM